MKTFRNIIDEPKYIVSLCLVISVRRSPPGSFRLLSASTQLRNLTKRAAVNLLELLGDPGSQLKIKIKFSGKLSPPRVMRVPFKILPQSKTPIMKAPGIDARLLSIYSMGNICFPSSTT